MAQSNGTLTRLRAKSILDNVSGLTASRVVIGTKDWKPSDEFLQELPTAGPLIVIRPTDYGDYNMETTLCESTMKIVMWIGYADDADQTYMDIEDLFISVYQALMTPSNWSSGNLPYRAPEVEVDDEYNKKPRVIEYTITLNFNAPL